jgi:hypothetical protein
MRWADLRFMSGPSPRPLKEALGSDYASLAEKHAETRPREPPPRVFHVTGTFKNPKDAATVLSGSRQDEVMARTWPALGSMPRRLLARSRSCRAVIRARPEMTKSTSRKLFTKGSSLNVEGKAAWDDHRRRQAETLAFLNQSAEQPVEPPAPLTAEAALDQAGQEFGAIMLTRKPHAGEVAAWPLDWRQALT